MVTKSACKSQFDLCQQYLHAVYHHANLCRRSNKIQDIAETYGEILVPSVNALLTKLALTEQDVFVDLGSGVGKVVLQVFLQSMVKESRGIEILPALHQQALLAASRVRQDLPQFYENGRTVTFLAGDFLTTPLIGATVVLIGSPCFTPTMLTLLGRLIDATPSIHSVLTLRPLATLKRLAFKKAVRVECSWDTSRCYLYGEKL